jgi:hypothetical protein
VYWFFLLMTDRSLKTKKDIDHAITSATGIAKELEDVRSKRQRFCDDPILAALTRCATTAVAQTLRDAAQDEPTFRKSTAVALQPLTTALLESGIEERKVRYRSSSCAYTALMASEALLALVRREYALSETLLALTTALSSPATQTTINTGLKMSDTALTALMAACNEMRASPGSGIADTGGGGDDE